MQRRSVVTFVCFAYLVYCAVILGHGLLASIARPRGHLAPWLICATLGLLCRRCYLRKNFRIWPLW